MKQDRDELCKHYRMLLTICWLLAVLFLPIESVSPETYVKSDLGTYRESKIGIFYARVPYIEPLWLYGSEEHRRRLGFFTANLIHREILKKHIFRGAEIIPCECTDVYQAMDIGQRRGLDLVLVGEVSSFFYGGLSSESVVTVNMRIIDVHTGSLLWYLEKSASGNPGRYFDYIFFQVDSSYAPFPQLLLEDVVKDLCGELLR